MIDYSELYEQYKKDWIEAHGSAELMEEAERNYERRDPEDADMSLDEYIEEYGFPNGESWVCYDEFLQNDIENYIYVDFTGCLQNLEQVALSDGYIDMSIGLDEKNFKMLVEKTELLDVMGVDYDTLMREYRIKIAASLYVDNGELSFALAAFQGDKWKADALYEPTTDECNTVRDEIDAHAKRIGLTFALYEQLAKDTIGGDGLASYKRFEKEAIAKAKPKDALEH